MELRIGRENVDLCPSGRRPREDSFRSHPIGALARPGNDPPARRTATYAVKKLGDLKYRIKPAEAIVLFHAMAGILDPVGIVDKKFVAIAARRTAWNCGAP